MDDVTFEAGKFVIASADRAVDIREVAKRSFHSTLLPNDIEIGFTERANFGPANAATFPSGTHLCVVELDSDTGQLAVTRYTAVDDCGTVLNPPLCEGQIHGGIVQGIDQVLMGDIVYDPDSGQLLSGAFQDYWMPRADDFCHFELGKNESLSPNNPLGLKGVGEAGTLGAIPAVMNAVNDALARIGAPPIEMPATPEKVWRAIRIARDKYAHS